MKSSAPRCERAVPALPASVPLLRLTSPDAAVDTDRPVLLIGSRRDCDLPIVHSDVSKLHAAICNTGHEILICDLRSRCGTFVNDQSVLSGRLRPGDRLRIAGIEVGAEFIQGDDPSDSIAPPCFPHELRLVLSGQTLSLATQPAVIGRRNNCDVFLDTPDVSLAHAVIVCVSGRPAIFDLGSRSGTLINGERVTLAWLEDGDTINIGGELLRVELQAPPPVIEAARPPAPEPAVHRAVPQPAAAPPAPVPPPAHAGADAGDAVAALVDALSLPPASAEAGASGDVLGLESTIVALQARLSGFRAKLDQRAAALDQRDAALRQRELDVDALGASLADERGALDAARAELDQAREALAAQQTAALADQAALEQRRKSVMESARVCQELKAQQEARQSQLDALQHDLATRQTQLDEELASLQAQWDDISRQRSTLTKERDDHRQRETALHAAQADAEQQKQALAAERHKLEAEHKKLARERGQVKRQADELTARQTELQTAQSELAGQRAALKKDQGALVNQQAEAKREREELQQQSGTLKRQRDQLTREQHKLTADADEQRRQRDALTAERGVLETHTAGLAQREAQLAQREQSVVLSEQALARREADLAQRESATQATIQRIEQIKNALQSASMVFSDAGEMDAAPSTPARDPAPPDQKPPSAAPAASPAPAPRRRPAGAAQSANGNHTKPPAAPTAIPDLPAPMVDQPLFDASEVADLPPEVRERLRVLRRVSSKPEHELVAQVLAEAETRKQQRLEADQNGKKKRWWS